MLTPHMVTSVLVSFIPLMIQRISRHTEHLTRKMFKRYKELRPVLQSLLLAITPIPPLKSFVPTLQAVVNQGRDAPQMGTIGEWFVSFMKALSTLSFDGQVQVVTIIVPNWIPLMHKIMAHTSLSHALVPTKEELTHRDASCDGCGCKPIIGPLFKCQSCDYDLCGECYPMRSSLHCPLHEFSCILRPKNKKCNIDSGIKKAETAAKEKTEELDTDSSSDFVDTDELEQTSEEDSPSEEKGGEAEGGCPFVEAAKKALSRKEPH
ncbi:hypothetical protein Pmar_PMAR021244 [Perkinsus marinus ATCC 50983]|uniref:ZZ-type domain-containing protein n=1 Tax=Perkinsus marinus (strain ATCC 50983 / TXsc) TaxID=423536 RepID=C5K5M3_PERM5|nr:hypothetical protein Pmar_PMAR021244 [Perkinsus marinus ATCC 50983]EER20220.1 hypothetical protein Pmar_PMAR021244 [Perkinsus marinus ATCC 50983]|eukprot:XP_002788424.1 hypothetical protein Pmar_PMAR021244 [Perkinsus marinus ATCC 50983]